MIKYYLKLGLKISGVILLIIILKTLYVGGVFKQITNYNAGRTEHIYTNMWGTEDMAFDSKHKLLFISSSNRWATLLKGENPLDGIYALDLTDSLNSAPKKILTTFSGDFHPHGISILQQGESTYIFAVNHNKTGSYIEKFIFKNGTLIHIESYSNNLMFSPNDIVTLSDTTFYVTNDHGSKTGFSKLLEDYLQQSKSYVLYFDGTDYKPVIQNLQYANGIAVSHDKKTLYVAEATGQKISIYDILDNGRLNLKHYIKTHTGVDNITVDSVGDLWVGAHPKLLKFTGHAKDSTKLSPSEVLQIHLQANGIFKTTQIYINDGQEISGSSVAFKYQDYLFIGDVFGRKLVKVNLKR